MRLPNRRNTRPPRALRGWLGIGSERAQRHYERGLHYFDEGQFDLAVADLTEALRLDGKCAEFYAARGLFQLQMNLPGRAEADFISALKRDPQEMLAHYGRGMLCYLQAAWGDALEHFMAAKRIAPERAEIYYCMAVVYYYLEDKEAARDAIDFSRQLFDQSDPRLLDAAKWQARIKRMPNPPRLPPEFFEPEDY